MLLFFELFIFFKNTIDLISKLLYDQLPPILRLLIPFTLTIYLFSYKERKEVTYSYLKQKRFTTNHYLTIISTLFLLISLFVHYYAEVRGSLFNLIFLIIFSFWAYTIIKTYLDLFSSVNIFEVKDKHIVILKKINLSLQKTNKKHSKRIELVDRMYNKNQINSCSFKVLNSFTFLTKWKYIRTLKELDIAIQILTQILLSKTKYNLSKDVSSLLSSVIEELYNFLNNNNKTNFIENLASLNIINDYESVYTTILKNIEMLVESSLKHSRSEDLHKLLSILKSMTVPPFVIKKSVFKLFLKKNKYIVEAMDRELNYLRKSHIKTIKSITSTLHSHEYSGDLTLVRSIINLSKEGNESSTGLPSEEAIFTLQLAIIIEAIIKNNIKLLTDIVNITLENNQPKTKDSIYEIFVLSSVKAIEQGHYKCAGHLVKMIVKNEGVDYIKQVTKTVYNHFTENNSYNENEFLKIFKENID
ncbi:hypothetical protein CHH88_03045, partial [Bacillus subtilis]